MNNLDNKEQIIIDDFLSEKGSSLNNDSPYALDSENNNEESNNNDA